MEGEMRGVDLLCLPFECVTHFLKAVRYLQMGGGEIAMCIQRFPMLEPDGCPCRSLDAESDNPGKVLPHVDHSFALGSPEESKRCDFLVRPHERSSRRHQMV